MNIKLWEFPAADFADWNALVGSPEVASHADYMTLLAAVQADNERQGYKVLRVKMTVAKGTPAPWRHTSRNRRALWLCRLPAMVQPYHSPLLLAFMSRLVLSRCDTTNTTSKCTGDNFHKNLLKIRSTPADRQT